MRKKANEKRVNRDVENKKLPDFFEYVRRKTDKEPLIETNKGKKRKRDPDWTSVDDGMVIDTVRD